MTPSLKQIDNRLEKTLIDIAQNIEIQTDFTITHPQYDPIELPTEIKDRFPQIPESVRDNYLEVKLQGLISDRYHNCTPTTPEVETIENQAIKWSKSEFYHQLRTNNHCDAHFESNWLVIGQTEEGFLQVRKQDLTLHINRNRHLKSHEKNARIGDIIAVKMPPQLVEPGFYIAVGSKGSIDDLPKTLTIVDVYFDVNASGALALMDLLTARLDKVAIPFHFKVLYDSDTYQWCDAAVLSFTRNDYVRVKPILNNIYRQTKAYFQPQTPLFTKYLAEGLALAERPLNNGSLPKTFTLYGSQLIARGLVAANKAQQDTPEAKLQSIYDRFKKAKIALTRPYLNCGSEDIYQAIETNTTLAV